MSLLRRFVAVSVLLVVSAVGSQAQQSSTSLARYVSPAKAAQGNFLSDQAPSFSLRLGLMFSPRGAGIAGLDVTIPQLSILTGWTVRVDADAIIKANFGGANTVFPVTFNLINNVPGTVGGRSAYFGIGAGGILGSGKTEFVAKGTLGAGLSRGIAAEANVLFGENDTVLSAVIRLHK